MVRSPLEKRIFEKYGETLSEFMLREHVKKKRSMNEIAKEAGVIRQSLAHACRVRGIPVRGIKAATRLTKNKGEAHWAYGKRKETNALFAKHSDRMSKRNPTSDSESLTRAAKTRSKTFKRKPWPQESVFMEMLAAQNIPFIFQFPIGSYIIDFFLPQTGLCIEIDSTDHWGAERRLAAQKKDSWLRKNGYPKILRINKNHVSTRGLDILKAYNLILN